MSTRDSELYKDKVEVSLDGRQIFYLFFGGAVIVGMVFVLGVLVGRRVEARGHIDRAHTAAATDPLAALDRLESSDGMAFRGALSGKTNEAPVDKAIADLATQRGTAPIVEPKKTDKKVDDKAVKTEDKKSEDKKSEDKKSDDKKVEKKDDKKSDEKKADDKKKAEAKSEEPKDQKVEAKAETKSDAKADAKSEAKTDTKTDAKSETKTAKTDEKKSERYTLQLSSFQDKTEAETFLETVKAKGFSASISVAEVDGRGTFYRVRMGSYKSLDAATSAKSDFEKAASHNASIMKL